MFILVADRPVDGAVSSTPGVPLKPMLAKICEGIPDALAQLKDKGATFLAEYKYDGQRAQIHLLPDGSVGFRSIAPQQRICWHRLPC